VLAYLFCSKYFFLSAWTPTGYLLIFATYKQQMERRSVRIQQRRERLAERQDLGDEEHIAPPPGGRQNRGRQHNQRHGHEQPHRDNIPIIEEIQEEGGEEVNQENEQELEEELPPPPPTLAEIMDRQTRLMEAIARRPENGNGQGKMAAFMRLHPPTFDNSEDDPLVADDWLRTIIKKLNAVRATDEEKVTLATHQLIGAAGEWWENYQDAVDYPEDITWEEFMEAFRKYHIPEGVMEMKAEEFRYLRQGAMTVNQYIRKFMKLSRYAPEAVNTDKKKQICFRRGLNSALRTQIISHVYPDFNTMMNRTILLEAELLKAEGEKKRKFNLQHARQQERTQRIKTNNAPRYQPTMQYRTPGFNSQQAAPTYRSYSTGNQPKNTSNTTPASDHTCYGC
jgi:hypothetical protein